MQLPNLAQEIGGLDNLSIQGGLAATSSSLTWSVSEPNFAPHGPVLPHCCMQDGAEQRSERTELLSSSKWSDDRMGSSHHGESEKRGP